ncbi:hypothetical protein ACFQGT_09755 [Natrialbaceae archaeon GCM10025810]|uniref:hypothetical protein n=1 Tax=Halovalidus salilacus TaxID=3075124 RepID=UPI003613408E
MYLEITAPAICIETDRHSGSSVKIHGEVTQEIDVEMPNPNLDFYLDPDWIGDYRISAIEGRRWELELSEAEVTIELTVDELRRSAQIRAAEDHCLEHEVLNRWASLNPHGSLERTFQKALCRTESTASL